MAEAVGRLLTSSEFRALLHDQLLRFNLPTKDGSNVAVSLAELLPSNMDHFNPEFLLEVPHIFMAFKRLENDTYGRFLRIQRNRKMIRSELMRQLYNPNARRPWSAGSEDLPDGIDVCVEKDVPVPKSLEVAKSNIELHPAVIKLNALNDQKEADFNLNSGICDGIKMYWEALREYRTEKRGERPYAGQPKPLYEPEEEAPIPTRVHTDQEEEASKLRSGLKGFRRKT